MKYTQIYKQHISLDIEWEILSDPSHNHVEKALVFVDVVLEL